MNHQTATPPNLATQFHSLGAEWRAATRFLSSPTEVAEHPSYRAIIALGFAVVPLILAELALSPQQWFAALSELTGEDPVPASDRYRPALAAEHWLAWGRERGLV